MDKTKVNDEYDGQEKSIKVQKKKNRMKKITKILNMITFTFFRDRVCNSLTNKKIFAIIIVILF